MKHVVINSEKILHGFDLNSFDFQVISHYETTFLKRIRNTYGPHLSRALIVINIKTDSLKTFISPYRCGHLKIKFNIFLKRFMFTRAMRTPPR